MKDSKGATLEFVQQQAAGNPSQALTSEQQTEASREAGFEFVKQLAAELSTGSFELPPFPEAALRVRDALNDPQVDVDRIARIVLSEPVLSARLLRLANSALLKRGTMEITDVKQTIGRLGFEMVRNAAVSMAMDSSFPMPRDPAIRQYFETTRTHSVRVAVLSYILAKHHAQGIKADDALLTGLLHDIGRFYILTRVTAFPELFRTPQALEELVYGWHTGVGRAIIESWGFSASIAEAVDEHEVLDREHQGNVDLADVIMVANLLSHIGEPRDPPLPPFNQIPACRKLQLNEHTCINVVQDAEEEVRSMTLALGG